MSETAVEELNPVAAGDDVEHKYLEKEKSCFENIKVKHLLAQLSPRQREALTLYYIGYPLLIAYIYYAFRIYLRKSSETYYCGNCGVRLHRKGRCPHCGAVNE